MQALLLALSLVSRLKISNVPPVDTMLTLNGDALTLNGDALILVL